MRRLGVGDLQSVLAPIVATLALPREALSEGCLFSFLGGVVTGDDEGWALVERALGVLKPMLRRTVNSEGEEAYTLYHHSLAEHVRGSERMVNAVKLAAEHADDSPLIEGAEQWLAEGNCEWTWLRRSWQAGQAAVSPCLAVLEGHTDVVFGAIIRKDRTILSWCGDGTLRLWSSTGEPLTMLKGHTDALLGVIIREDDTILSWAQDKTLRQWAYNGQPLSVMPYPPKAQDYPVELLDPEKQAGECHVFAEDNTAILVNRATVTTHLWHAGSKCEAHHLLPDGRIFASLDDGQLCVLRLYFGNRQIGLDKISALEA